MKEHGAKKKPAKPDHKLKSAMQAKDTISAGYDAGSSSLEGLPTLAYPVNRPETKWIIMLVIRYNQSLCRHHSDVLLMRTE